MSKAKIVVIEGLDGAGKETASKALKKHLEFRGLKVEMISFPMYDKWHSFLVRLYLKGKFGKDPKTVNPKLTSFFYAIDRFFAWHFSIKKIAKNVDYIIFDRYSTSNMLYQSSKAKSLKEADEIIDFNVKLEYDLMRLPKPDVVVVLRNDMAVMAKNLATREVLDIHETNPSYMIKVRDRLDHVIKYCNWRSMSVINDSGEMIHPNIIAQLIWCTKM